MKKFVLTICLCCWIAPQIRGYYDILVTSERNLKAKDNFRFKIKVTNLQVTKNDKVFVAECPEDGTDTIIRTYLHGINYSLPDIFFPKGTHVCIWTKQISSGSTYRMELTKLYFCNGVFYNDEEGDIVSPGYPESNSLGRQTCKWKIQAPKGRKVQINLIDIDLPKGNGNVVNIRPVVYGEKLQDLKLVGSILPEVTKYTTVSRNASINYKYEKYKSDKNFRGFRLSFKVIGCMPEEIPFDGLRRVFLNMLGEYYQPGYALRYKCPVGYRFHNNQSENQLVCYDRSWTGNLYNCTVILCDDPVVPSNMVIKESDGAVFGVGSSVSYRCQHGQLVGSTISVCTADGTWSHQPPACVEPTTAVPTCADPGRPAHARRIGERFYVGSNVTYLCEKGFKSLGPSSRICLRNLTWSETQPTCEQILCKGHSDPENGHISLNISKPGGEVIYYCDIGFVLIGQNRRICTNHGTWTGIPPVCQEISCTDVIVNKHTYVIYAGRGLYDRVSFRCDEGYELDGVISQYCMPDGHWSGRPPICRKNSQQQSQHSINQWSGESSNEIAEIVLYSGIGALILACLAFLVAFIYFKKRRYTTILNARTDIPWKKFDNESLRTGVALNPATGTAEYNRELEENPYQTI